MTIADWAFVVSLFSAALSLFSLGWNVWSKWVHPKPRIVMSMAVMNLIGGGRPGISEPFIAIYATNHGPTETTLKTLICRSRAEGWWRKRGNARWKWAFMISHQTPDQALAGNNNPFGGFPHKLPVGDEFVTYLVFKHEHLRDDDIVDIGIVDVFERRHWVPRSKVRDVVKRVREEFPKEKPGP